jgi:hypothetical protein
MQTILNKFNSYNYLTKFLLITLLFGILSLEFLFFWAIVWLGSTAAYHLYKAFNDHDVHSENSPLLCQKEFENGKNESNFLFFIIGLFCLFQGELLLLVGLGLFFIAKAIFINSNIIIKSYNLNP